MNLPSLWSIVLFQHPAWIKFFRWLMFSVLFAFLPLVFDYVHLITSRPLTQITDFEEVIRRGQLLLISVGIGAAAVGELIAPNYEGYKVFRLIAAGGCMVIVVFAAFYYAEVSSSGVLRADLVRIISWRVFVGTCVASAACIFLADDLRISKVTT